MTSRNIAKLTSLQGLIVLRATCGCTSEDHSQDIMLSVQSENDTDSIEACIQVNLEHISDTYDDHIISVIWKRIKAACSILFTGRIELSHTFYFENAEQIKDYTDAISTAYNEMQEFRNK